MVSRLLRIGAVSATAWWLMSCGAGIVDVGGGEGGDAASLDQQGSFADDDIRHLLVRTHFGVRQADYDRAVAIGVPAFVDEMLSLPEPGSTAWDVAADPLLRNDSDPPGFEGGFPSSTQLSRWWTELMLQSEHPFQEVVAMFWHDHFAASATGLDGSQRAWMKEHVNLFRRAGTGNLRQLLIDVSRDPVMLDWLDGTQSTKGEPNENFAREFWELFTLGVDNGYTEHDIKEGARAFTGYRSRYDSATRQSRIEFDADRHDVGAKVILDSIIPNGSAGDNYAAMVDATLGDRDVAGFLCRKMLAHFCYDDPPAGLVNALARVLRDNDYEIAPVLRRMLLSKAFYSSRAKEGLVRSPLHFAIGFARTTGLRPTVNNTDSALSAMAHRPAQPPSVDGWPIGDEWLSAQGMVERANFVRRCITSRSFQSDAGIDVADLLPAADATAEAVVDRFAWLLRIDLSVAERATCIAYLNTNRKSDGSDEASDFDPTQTRHREERMRGLLYILAQHPSFMVR